MEWRYYKQSPENHAISLETERGGCKTCVRSVQIPGKTGWYQCEANIMGWPNLGEGLCEWYMKRKTSGKN